MIFGCRGGSLMNKQSESHRFNILIVLSGLFLFFQSGYSDIGLYRHIDLSNHPVNDCRMSIGDLNGDGQIDFVFNDGRRIIKAFDHDGNLLWEKINPDDPGVEERFHNFSISVFDIDRDGADEVICFLEIDGNHCLAVVNGTRGEIESSVVLPYPAPRDHPFWGNRNFYMQNHTAIANLRGLSYPQDILAMHVSKQKVAAYAFRNGTLELLWFWVSDADSYASGHYSYAYDFDEDGRDEVIAGVDVLDESGNRLWKMPLLPWNPSHPDWGMDHTDAISCADIRPEYPGKEIVIAARTGAWMFTHTGETLWHHPSKTTDPRNGWFAGQGVQEVLIGNFRSDIPGLEIVFYSASMAGHQSVGLFDKDGNPILWGDQNEGPRRLTTYAMDWDGDRRLDEIYSRRGVFDGRFNRLSYTMNWRYVNSTDVDEFPPIVCDFQGDHREEILWYDQNEILVIYNTDDLTVEPLPSPWNHLTYKLRYANNHHCNAMYFDWSALDDEIDVDNTPPNPPRNLMSPNQTTSSIQIEWDTPIPAQDGDGAAAYNIYRNESLIKTLTGTEYDDVGLTANTMYTYAVYSVDDEDNQSLTAATGTFKTVSVLDIIPPNPPGDLISPSHGETEITLSWSMPPMANDGDTASYYCIMRNGILIGTTVTTSFTDSNLTANTEYRYEVFSMDDADNQSIQAISAVFRTSPSIDTIPPNAPTNLTSPVQTTESISIQWVSSAVAVDGNLASYYRIYRNDELIGTTPGNEFSDTGLQENTSYNYRVFAVDHVGNQSIDAATGIFSTLYIPENEIDSALTAIIVLGQASPWGERRIPVTLVTTKPVSRVPSPLILTESDGSDTVIPVEGLTPGQKFMGILFLDDSVAEGPAFFRLQDRLVKADGQVGVSTISKGDSVYIDKTPPSNPAILHMRK